MFVLMFLQSLTAKHHEMEVSNASLCDEIKQLTVKGNVVSSVTFVYTTQYTHQMLLLFAISLLVVAHISIDSGYSQRGVGMFKPPP